MSTQSTHVRVFCCQGRTFEGSAHWAPRLRGGLRHGQPSAQTWPAFFLISFSSRSPRSVAWYSSLMPVRVFLRASFDEA